MPAGEIEKHPYLQVGELKGATKLILGSFPVYYCTDDDNELKRQHRENNGTIRFFYGSHRSKFWGLYKEYIDKTVPFPLTTQSPNLILKSLCQNNIAISDLIVSCTRDGLSASDSRLKNIEYNKDGIQVLINCGVNKILCTSKKVLRDLEKCIIQDIGSVDYDLSFNFQSQFISAIKGDNNLITKPIATIFHTGNTKVTALAIPSPGSPYRQLGKFGNNGTDNRTYAQNYYSNAFKWLNE